MKTCESLELARSLARLGFSTDAIQIILVGGSAVPFGRERRAAAIAELIGRRPWEWVLVNQETNCWARIGAPGGNGHEALTPRRAYSMARRARREIDDAQRVAEEDQIRDAKLEIALARADLATAEEEAAAALNELRAVTWVDGRPNGRDGVVS
jgi:hypothetical protein